MAWLGLSLGNATRAAALAAGHALRVAGGDQGEAPDADQDEAPTAAAASSDAGFRK